MTVMFCFSQNLLSLVSGPFIIPTPCCVGCGCALGSAFGSAIGSAFGSALGRPLGLGDALASGAGG